MRKSVIERRDDLIVPVSEDEWKVRVDLAACYRLVAHFEMDDLFATHITVKVPGPEMHFLLNPYGVHFSEVTASSLVKVDLDGNIVSDTDHVINPAGFVIHSAIHANRRTRFVSFTPIRSLGWQSQQLKRAFNPGVKRLQIL